MACFNLAIEMLIISGSGAVGTGESRLLVCFNLAIEMLIISGSIRGTYNVNPIMFQSRNRDAYHFRARDAVTTGRIVGVSISQSRCLSFQVGIGHDGRPGDKARFNLAIEMLVISGL